MLKYLIPRIRRADLPPMFAVAVVGAALAGGYGVLHDQVTYTIAPEYFTNLKFRQFHYADFGWGDRVFVATIGFLATWWVGLIAGWLLARRLIPDQPRQRAVRQIAQAIGCMFAVALLFGAAAYLFGLWRGPSADYSRWSWAFQRYSITDQWAFVRVAYIHNAGYLGGLAGFIIALVAIRPANSTPDARHQPPQIV